MAKESKRKVKTKGLSSPKYISSDDDDASYSNGINKKAREEISSLGSTSWGSRGFAWARKEKYMWAQKILKTWEGEKWRTCPKQGDYL
jgi:hypothetical protein